VILAALAASQLNSTLVHCQLEDRWKAFFIAKNGNAVSAIQNRHDCCGFNSALDRAYPFPSSNNRGALECSLAYERDTACVTFWQDDQREALGLLLGVSIACFFIRTGVFILFNRQAVHIPWTRLQRQAPFSDEPRFLAYREDEEEGDFDVRAASIEHEEQSRTS
jgi:hypothetical protein